MSPSETKDRFQALKLNRANYPIWSFQMIDFFEDHWLSEFIDGVNNRI